MVDINLLPWRSYLYEKQKEQFLLLLFSATLLSIVFLTAIHFSLLFFIAKENVYLNKLQRRFLELNFDAEKIRSRQVECVGLQTLFEKIRHIDMYQHGLLEFFQQISSLPASIVFLDLQKEHEKITLTGRNLSSSALTKFLDTFPEAQISEIQNQQKMSLIKFQFQVVQDEGWVKLA